MHITAHLYKGVIPSSYVFEVSDDGDHLRDIEGKRAPGLLLRCLIEMVCENTPLAQTRLMALLSRASTWILSSPATDKPHPQVVCSRDSILPGGIKIKQGTVGYLQGNRVLFERGGVEGLPEGCNALYDKEILDGLVEVVRQ